MKKNFDYDFFVIGAGSGGTRAARMAASKGIKTGIAEASRAGGTCVIRGCVPKKIYAYAAMLKDYFEIAPAYGYDMPQNPIFNWEILQNNKDNEIQRLEGIYQKLLMNSGCDFIQDHASFKSEHEIYLKHSKKIVTANKILIATGAAPRPLEINGQSIGFNSDDIFNFKTLPKKTLIYGSGYIAVEFAGILNALGTEVTIAYRSNHLLKNFDHDVSQRLENIYLSKNIRLIPNTPLDSIKIDHNQIIVQDNQEILKFDTIFNTIGRIPNIHNLGLEQANINVNPNGSIITNDDFSTNIENIYAIGDVSNKINLTPVAIQEAMCLTQNLFDTHPAKMDYDLIPTAVFSNPEIGTVGLTEKQAIEKEYTYQIFESDFRPLKYSITDKQIRNYMKVIVDQKTDIVIGVHLIGPESAEMIQLVGIAVKAKLTKKQFDDTMAVHPTSAEELVTMRTPKTDKAS